MRRIGIPVVLALATAGFTGVGDSAAARSSFQVGVDCWTEIGSALCDAVPIGGSGTFIAHDWIVEESPTVSGTPTSSYPVYGGSNPQLSSYCTPGYHVRVTVTVKDSTGATAVGNSGFTC